MDAKQSIGSYVCGGSRAALGVSSSAKEQGKFFFESSRIFVSSEQKLYSHRFLLLSHFHREVDSATVECEGVYLARKALRKKEDKDKIGRNIANSDNDVHSFTTKHGHFNLSKSNNHFVGEDYCIYRIERIERNGSDVQIHSLLQPTHSLYDDVRPYGITLGVNTLNHCDRHFKRLADCMYRLGNVTSTSSSCIIHPVSFIRAHVAITRFAGDVLLFSSLEYRFIGE